jgi:hypothetical protein
MAIDLYSKATLDTLLAAKLSDAPSDGTTYGRKDGAWEAIVAGSATWGAITGDVTAQTDLTTYLSSNYYPLTGNPSSFLTSVPGKTVNTPSSYPYTLTAGDTNNIVSIYGGTYSPAITVPLDSTYDFPIGTVILIVTNDTYNGINGESGVSINYGTGGSLGSNVVNLVKIGSNNWIYA